MKILEIYTFDENRIGGVSTMVKSYINAVDEFSKNGCKLELLNIPPKYRTGKSMIDNFIYIFTQRKAVSRHLKKNTYNAVHIHTSREFLFLKDLFLCKLIKIKFNIPIIITIHVGAIDTVYKRIGWFKKRSFDLINRYADNVIFLSETMRKVFIKNGLKESKTSLLYNFYNFTPSHKKYLKINDSLQLLFVGAIHREKGIIELLKALSKMPELNYHLNVCGQLKDNRIKDEIEYYKTILSDKVSFLGNVSGEDKTKIFMLSDILILPSYHEGLPLVILEALGAGCGIMTTAVGAIPEILSKDNCRWLDIASSDSIVAQLSQMTLDDLKKMKDRNKSLGNQYSLTDHINKLSVIYKSVCVIN